MDVPIPCACTLDTSLHPSGLKTSLRLYGLVRIIGFSDTPASIPPHTQDLTAIEILRSVRAIDSLVNGDINEPLSPDHTPMRTNPSSLKVAAVLIFEGKKYCIDHQRKRRVDQ